MWKNPPVGPSSGMRANATAVFAPSSTSSGARSVPISVFTQPGWAGFTLTLEPSKCSRRCDGQHVQRRFRRAVSRHGHFRGKAVRIAHRGHRSHNAGLIDNAPGRAGLQQRQQRLRYEVRRDDVRLVCLTECLSRKAAEIERDAGVVDENVQASELRLEESRKRLDIRLVGDIEFHGVRVNAFGSQLVRRRLRLCVVSRAQDYCDAFFPSWRAISKPSPLFAPVINATLFPMHFSSLPDACAHLPVHCGFLLSLNAAMPSRASCVMASRPIWPSPNAIASSKDIERIAFIA